jgi:hypothetical protein
MSMPIKSRVTVGCPLLFLLLAALPAVCRPEEIPSAGRLFHYKIESRGLGIGELKTTTSTAQYKGNRALRFQSELAVDAKLLFFKKIIRSREEVVVGEQGTLSYRKSSEENGKSYCVEGTLEGGSFHFTVQENGSLRKVTVARGSYDYTTMDCFETSLKREGEWVEVRLLDLEHAVVLTRRYRFLKSEEIEAGGRSIRCKLVEFSDSNSSCRRWVSKDERGVIIARQEGSGKGGRYSLRLISVTEATATKFGDRNRAAGPSAKEAAFLAWPVSRFFIMRT